MLEINIEGWYCASFKIISGCPLPLMLLCEYISISLPLFCISRMQHVKPVLEGYGI